ncbi:terminase small subunit [Acidobacteria bacterium AH-259-D05]|nr:terminase small subunit [Acidobacteria bacterium AH-259-D05]
MRPLTLRQRRFILAYVRNGGNRTQAALVAYDTTYATARVIGCENLTKPNIRREIDRLTEAVSLSTRDSLLVLKDALKATDANNHPDWGVRLKAVDMAIKIRGGYPKKQVSRQRQHTNERDPMEVIRAALEHDVL